MILYGDENPLRRSKALIIFEDKRTGTTVVNLKLEFDFISFRKKTSKIQNNFNCSISDDHQ